jgi:hypothetical protein
LLWKGLGSPCIRFRLEVMIIIRHAATSSLPPPPPPPTSPPTLPLSSTEICAKPQSRAHTRSPHQRREPQCADTSSPKGIGKQLPKESSHTVATAPFSSCAAATESPHLLQHRELRSALPQSRPLDIRIDGPGWSWVLHYSKLVLMLNGKADPNLGFKGPFDVRLCSRRRRRNWKLLD